MRRSKRIFVICAALILVLACCCAFQACNPDEANGLQGNSDVVKAFNAVSAGGPVVTQTAVKSGKGYLVTVITKRGATEYTLGEDFSVEQKKSLFYVKSEEAAAAEEGSALERAYAEALKLSSISPENVVGFDFDRSRYMGKDVYKVEIEEVGAEYKFVFDAADFTLLDSSIEFENDLPHGSYVSADAALEFALKAAGVTRKDVLNAVVREAFENGEKLYKICFTCGEYRYDVSVDALFGDIIKFSKSALDIAAPAVPDSITAEDAERIAVAFVFPGDAKGQYILRKVKLDHENGAFVYEVELVVGSKEYEFEIAASDGTILDVEIEGEDAPLPQNKRFITREQAIDAVKKHIGDFGAYVIEAEIEKEGEGAAKRYYYEIEVKTKNVKREFFVDALTGEVTDFESEIGDDAILEEDAVHVAMKHFGLEGQTIDRTIVKLEREDGRFVFVVKLYVGDMKHEAEIDALTGEVVDFESEREDFGTTPADLLSKEEAIRKVKELLGEGVAIKEAELEFENGRYVYEVEVALDGREYDYYVDALTGAVSKNEAFVEGGEVILDEKEALARALKHVGAEENSIQVRKIKLDRDDGRLCYDVEFFVGNVKYEIEIDATTGAVLDEDISFD